MVATIPYNPLPTTTAAGTFTTATDGDVQGVMFDDPAVRFALRGGIVGQTETLAMYGGIGVAEAVPTPSTLASPQADNSMGPILTRATTLTTTSSGGLTGFTVFNQAHNLVNSPESPVPLAASGMTIHYVRLGSGARLALACDPSFVSFQGGLVGAQFSWDFNTQRLVAYDASTTTISVSSFTYSSTTLTGTIATSSPSNVGAVGDAVYIAGATNTGTGGASAVNGLFFVNGFTSASAFTIAMPGTNSTIIGTIGGSIVLDQGTGALNVKLDRVNAGNSMTVVYNPTTGYFTWNYSGATAIVTI